MSDVLSTLRDEKVKQYFLAVLESEQTAEKKYGGFVAFFERYEALLREMASQPGETPIEGSQQIESKLSRASQSAGLWNPQEILSRVESCLSRALGRVRASRHRDGGWGYQVEQSNTWGTAHALFALMKAGKVLSLGSPVDHLIWGARAWLKEHSTDWIPYQVAPDQEKSLYEAALAARCLSDAGDASFHAVAETVAWIAANQNENGGWDARIRSAEGGWPRKVWSEVGATRMAIQTLIQSDNPALLTCIRKAAAWLAAVQNPDGSWNAGSCRPAVPKPDGPASIAKTCDALQGLISASRMGGGIPDYGDAVRRAVDWVMAREQLLRSEDGGVIGWGYDDRSVNPGLPDLDSTCLALETLVRAPDIPMAVITANAVWLMDAQHNEPGSPEDGKWADGDTYRITVGLLDFYTRIRDNAVFAASEAA